MFFPPESTYVAQDSGVWAVCMGSTEVTRTFNFRLFCGMLNALAFVPLPDVPLAMQQLKLVAPPSAQQLVSYFDETYVTGCIRTTPAGVRQLPTRFPPRLTWNVCQATIDGSARTNNFAESWNNHLQQLVEHKHPSIWRLIEVLQCDTAEASARISRQVVGNLSPKRQRKSTVKLQSRLQTSRQWRLQTFASGWATAGWTIRLIGRSWAATGLRDVFSWDAFSGMVLSGTFLPGTFFPPNFIEDVFTYPLFHAWTFFPGVEDVFSGDVFSGDVFTGSRLKHATDSHRQK
jgi:hypothetical protein